MYKRIHFFNGWHNGDIHVSREFVKWIVENVQAEEYVYSHLSGENIISDIDGLKYDPVLPLDKFSAWKVENNVLYINTWYRAYPYIHDRHGCTLQCLFVMFRDALKRLGVDLPNDILLFIPRIDYSKYDLGMAKPAMSKLAASKKVFISNGLVLSVQAKNFDFDPIVKNLASNFSNVTFILSNINNRIAKDNVLYSKDIIKSKNNDLNENAYISSLCPVIVGRASGSYTFACNTDNLLNESKVMINFGQEIIGSFGLNGLVPAKFVCSSGYENIEGIISDEIKKYWRL